MASTLSDSADRVFVEVPGDGGVCVAAHGRGFCMLNTWTQNAVHRDADRLMDLAPQIAERYCRLISRPRVKRSTRISQMLRVGSTSTCAGFHARIFLSLNSPSTSDLVEIGSH